MDNLLSENLIELHEQLSDFALHHYIKGGQGAHKAIKRHFINERKNEARSGGHEDMLKAEGYDRALKDVLSFLDSKFPLIL